MVEATNLSLLKVSSLLSKLSGPMQMIFSFLGWETQISMQLLSRRFYEKIIPSMINTIARIDYPCNPKPLILENCRTEIYVANWEEIKQIKKTCILRIQESATKDCVTLKDLLIEEGEISFQWFLPIW
jgi:hypothetical protein